MNYALVQSTLVMSHYNHTPAVQSCTTANKLYSVYKTGSTVKVAVSTNGGASWTEYDSSINFTAPHFVVDSTEAVHVVGEDASNFGRISYFTYASGSFSSVETVYQETTGSFGIGTVSAPFIALDSSDIPHVVWAWQWNAAGGYDVHYSNRSGGTWGALQSFFPSAFFLVTNARIAIDSNDVLYVLWIDSGGGSNQIDYSIYSSGSWSAYNNNTNATGTNFNVCVDSGDNVHMVFRNDSTHIKYVNYNGSSWSSATTLDTVDTLEVSIGVDRSDNLHVIYTNNGSTSGDLCYVTYTGSWSSPAVIVTKVVGTIGIIDHFMHTPINPKSGGDSINVPVAGVYTGTFINTYDSGLYYFPAPSVQLSGGAFLLNFV